LTVNLQFTALAPHTESVTATADVSDVNIQNPDPAQRVLIREEILDANPGRPGAPVSLPGLPIETASSRYQSAAILRSRRSRRSR